jgi:hypothetical protein
MELTIDEMMMAKQIVSSIVKDGISEQFLNSTEQFRKEIMLAYFDAEIKKFEKFQTKMMTNPEARKAFIESVFAII